MAGRRGSSRGLKRYIEKRSQSTFKIQITSMVDMFVILLVFLLKSYSTSPIQINPSKDLRLPQSTSTTEPQAEALKLVVSKQGIYVEDKKIISLSAGQLNSTDVAANDPRFIKALFEALDKEAEKSKSISKLNDTVHFEGHILMQADRDLPYGLLQKVMYTSSMAGYADLKLAVAVDN